MLCVYEAVMAVLSSASLIYYTQIYTPHDTYYTIMHLTYAQNQWEISEKEIKIKIDEPRKNLRLHEAVRLLQTVCDRKTVEWMHLTAGGKQRRSDGW